MNRLQRAWRRWRNGPPPPALTPEQEYAWRWLRALVREYARGGVIDEQARRQFEQFARDVEHDRRLQRERR